MQFEEATKGTIEPPVIHADEGRPEDFDLTDPSAFLKNLDTSSYESTINIMINMLKQRHKELANVDFIKEYKKITEHKSHLSAKLRKEVSDVATMLSQFQGIKLAKAAFERIANTQGLTEIVEPVCAEEEVTVTDVEEVLVPEVVAIDTDITTKDIDVLDVEEVTE